MSSAIHRLSDTLLRKLSGSPTTKNAFFNDGGNLSVRHSTSGLLTWYFTYRAGTGRQVSPERLRLGNYPDLSLKAAREKAAQCRAWLAEGKNPRYELNRAVQDALAPVTVKEALTYWLESYAKEKRTDYESLKSRINKHIISQIGALPLEKCELRHWLACFDQMAKRSPVSAGFLLQVCKQALKYCRKRRYAISNVLDDMVVGDVGKKAEVSERVLTNKELGELLRALDDKIFPPYYSALIRLLIVFGCRTTELRRSEVQEWDFKEMLWTVPKEHSKTKVAIFRPMPESILPFVTQLVEQNRHTGLLLGELKGQSSVAEYGRTAHRRINQAPWTLHDIRHTFTTMLNDLGVDPHIVEQLTAHQMPGMQRVYNHSRYLDAKRDALNLWVDRLELLQNNDEKIVVMTPRIYPQNS
ncbi:tyrosine-type recombinase/integrase [Escherichia coli]|uniref:Site-specific integrase n=1 Tax=Escherichia coli TaxID=562 RepID=A0A8T6PNH9_ECOLX|nr:site-specific integrase [Escherichia coli]KAE9880468.1 tyrosine-type recombinase/integrase [Escherichia coli]NEM71028.1 site-specific integrase [Escherichia coli]NEM84669.1 site-specific integrase [Escherichia coli]HEA0800723.1 site-specific integrase [Escherichia coli]